MTEQDIPCGSADIDSEKYSKSIDDSSSNYDLNSDFLIQFIFVRWSISKK